MSVNIFELRVKEDATPYLKKVGSTKQAEDRLDSPKLVSEILCKVFDADKRLEEHVWQICLDNQKRSVALFEISHGTMDCTAVAPANIYRRALLSSAASTVIAHNHPSGELIPSRVDDNITKSVVYAGRILGIPLNDHIIIGKRGEYYSFLEHNRLSEG